MTRSFSWNVLALVLAASLAGVNSAPAADNPAQEPAAKKAPAVKAARTLTKKERRERLKNLPEKYRDFLRAVEPIMLEEELQTFLLLESDPQRDLYIEQFWMRRDPDPKTAFNEYREKYTAGIEEAKAEFGQLSSDRAKIYLVQGRPNDRIKVDCETYLVPIEVWRWESERQWGSDRFALFYKPRVGVSEYRLWIPMGRTAEDLRELLSFSGEQAGVEEVFFGGRGKPNALWMQCMNGEVVLRAIAWI
ncbi:MAG TPA: GWxTD domain-containing protein, partial [Thermoanaerobaculia bacterium]